MRFKATIYPIIPEPCEFCASGLAWMKCHDDKLRCNNCVHRYANEMGWDTPLETQTPGRSELVGSVEEIPTKHITYDQPKLI